MARRKLVDVEREQHKALCAEVVVRKVKGSRKLLRFNIEPDSMVAAAKFPGVEGSIVWLKPDDGCTIETLGSVEGALKRDGAVAVIKLPAQSHEQVVAEQEVATPKTKGSLRDALEEALDRIGRRDQLSYEEMGEHISLAEELMDVAEGQSNARS